MRIPMTDTDFADRESIRDLLARNTAWLEGYGVDPETVFAPQITLHSARGEVTGIPAVAERIGPKPDADTRFQHFFTDIVITLDGDTADLQANLLVHGFRAGQAPHNTRGLRAHYGAARIGGRWLFTDAGITPLWEKGEPLF
jgi:hypothetical protein